MLFIMYLTASQVSAGDLNPLWIVRKQLPSKMSSTSERCSRSLLREINLSPRHHLHCVASYKYLLLNEQMKKRQFHKQSYDSELRSKDLQRGAWHIVGMLCQPTSPSSSSFYLTDFYIVICSRTGVFGVPSTPNQEPIT